MEEILEKLQKRFPPFPKNMLRKLYKVRLTRVGILMFLGLPEEIRYIIEGKARNEEKLPKHHLPGTGRSSYAKKRRAKRLGSNCPKCVRWTCAGNCPTIGMPSTNRDDKINFTRDGLSKEDMTTGLKILESHPSGDVRIQMIHLWFQFREEWQRLGDLIEQDPVREYAMEFFKKPSNDLGESISGVAGISIGGGPFAGTDTKYADEAIKVGEMLAKENINVIYGGGSMGLMGAVATTVYANGGNITGVMPKNIKPFYGQTWGKEIPALNNQDRVSIMYQLADAFIVLPGGFDTLEELACVASWSSSTMHRKPVCFLNINNYFNDLFSFLDKAVEKGFMFSTSREIMCGADTVEELLNKLNTYEHYSRLPKFQLSVLGKRKREYDNNGVDVTLSL